MTDPVTHGEALRTQVELLRAHDRHAFYCGVCLNKAPCPVAKVYKDAIAATGTLIEITEKEGQS